MLLNMNKQRSKYVISVTGAKSRLSVDKALPQVSKLDAAEKGKKSIVGRISNIGSTGSRTFLYRRGDRLKTPKYQNTYRLDAFRPFHPEVADKIVHDIMESKLSTVTTYQPDQISKLSMEISEELIKCIQKKDFDRYKLVAQVSIIQRLHQSIQSVFECFWDMHRDNYSYYVFENCHVYAWCCLFGLYYE